MTLLLPRVRVPLPPLPPAPLPPPFPGPADINQLVEFASLWIDLTQRSTSLNDYGFTRGPYTTAEGDVPCADGEAVHSLIPALRPGIARWGDDAAPRPTFSTAVLIGGAPTILFGPSSNEALRGQGAASGSGQLPLFYPAIGAGAAGNRWWFGLKGRIIALGINASRFNFVSLHNVTSLTVNVQGTTGEMRVSANAQAVNSPVVTVAPGDEFCIAAYCHTLTDGDINTQVWLNAPAPVNVANLQWTGIPAWNTNAGLITGIGSAPFTWALSAFVLGGEDGGDVAAHTQRMQDWVSAKL